MKVRLLSLDDYNKYFYFNQPETGCGIEMDRDVGDNYFFIQVLLPKSFFEISPVAFIGNPFVKESDVPENVLVKFELFGIGNASEARAFIFKPWIVEIDNPLLLRELESFLFFIPQKLLFNLLLRVIFIEQFSLPQLKTARVLEDISDEAFEQFGLGLYKTSIIPCYETARFSFSNAVWKDSNKDIEKFYVDNDCVIEPHLINKYFRPSLNTWFTIRDKNNYTIYGYLRLYNTNSTFTGGMSVEYIVHRKVRNKGVATEALKGLIAFLEEHSFAFTLSAEVKDENVASVQVLKKSGFSEQTSGSMLLNDNYSIDLIRRPSIQFEEQYDDGDIQFRIDEKYLAKFRRYFL